MTNSHIISNVLSRQFRPDVIGKSELVSVIVNVKNGSSYLALALASIQSQTHTNIEVIVWDNCSTDNSVDLAKSFARNDSRFRVVESETPVSLYEARNSALAAARGSKVAFLDSDDEWASEKLEIAIETMRITKCNIFYSNFETIGPSGESKKSPYPGKLPDGDVLGVISSNYVIALSSIVFDRLRLQSFKGPFNPKYSILGDFDLMLRIAKFEKFCCSQDPLLRYRVHGQNLSSDHVKRKIENALFSKYLDASKDFDLKTTANIKCTLLVDELRSRFSWTALFRFLSSYQNLRAFLIKIYWWWKVNVA